MAQEQDPEAIKRQIAEINDQITDLRQQITEAELRIEELQNEKQALTRRLPFNDRFNQLFK